MFITNSTKSSTFLFLFAVCQLFAKTVTCAPAPNPDPNPDTADQIDNSYSGAGGHASGGGVTTNQPNPNSLLGGMGLLDIASGNGGRGGIAKSGPAVAGSRPVTITGSGSSDPNGSSGSTSHSVGNAYSGVGGNADGGSVTNNPSLVKLFSGNGGPAGDASSGSSGPVGLLLSSVGSSPRRGGRTRVARFYKINRDRMLAMES